MSEQQPSAPLPDRRSIDLVRQLTDRRLRGRRAMAGESWPEFFRGLALQTAVIVGLAVLVVLVLWILRG